MQPTQRSRPCPRWDGCCPHCRYATAASPVTPAGGARAAAPPASGQCALDDAPSRAPSAAMTNAAAGFGAVRCLGARRHWACPAFWLPPAPHGEPTITKAARVTTPACGCRRSICCRSCAQAAALTSAIAVGSPRPGKPARGALPAHAPAAEAAAPPPPVERVPLPRPSTGQGPSSSAIENRAWPEAATADAAAAAKRSRWSPDASDEGGAMLARDGALDGAPK